MSAVDRSGLTVGRVVWGRLPGMFTPCRVLAVRDSLFGRVVDVEVVSGSRMGERHTLAIADADPDAAVLYARLRGVWPPLKNKKAAGRPAAVSDHEPAPSTRDRVDHQTSEPHPREAGRQ